MTSEERFMIIVSPFRALCRVLSTGTKYALISVCLVLGDRGMSTGASISPSASMKCMHAAAWQAARNKLLVPALEQELYLIRHFN